MTRRLSIAALLALILGVTTGLLLAGCDKDEATCRPEVPAGRIEGRVRFGGLPVSAEIVATRIPEGSHARIGVPDQNRMPRASTRWTCRRDATR